MDTAASVLLLSLCLSALAARAACCPPRGPGTAAPFRLLLLHTNDMHSSFEEVNAAGMPCGEYGETCYGGFARLKRAVADERSRLDTDADVGALVLDAGDVFQGTMYYTVFRWRIVADLLPKVGFDAMCLGNHEFDDGVNAVDSFLEHINLPVVVSNLDLSKEPSLASRKIMTKSTIVEVKGRKIGIIGYLTPDAMSLSLVGNVKVNDEITSIREEAMRLKSDGIKIIIALGHSGFDMDRKIANEVEEVDVVVGGHSHTFLYSGEPPSWDRPVGSYPFCVTQSKTNKKVPVVQAFHGSKYLGKLWVDFDDNGVVLSSSGNPILLDSSIDQDAEMLKNIINYQSTFYEKTKEVIGQTKVLLEGSSLYCRIKECNFGNFITDAYAYYNAQTNTADFDTNRFWTDAPIVLQHSGAIRANIDSSSNKNGDITYHQLVNSMPFTNTLGKVYLTGEEIKKTLEHAVFRYNGIKHCGEFLQVSGLKITIDFSKPGGERVSSILVKSRLRSQPGKYLPIQNTEKYKVIMNEYTWNGGDGYDFDKEAQKFVNIGLSDFEIVAEHIRKNSPISPTVEGRITLTNIDRLKTNDLIPCYSFRSKVYRAPFCGNDPEN